MTTYDGPRARRPSRLPPREHVVTSVLAVVVAVGGALVPTAIGPALLLVAVGTATVVLALCEPVAAVLLLVVTLFLRTAVHGEDLPVPVPTMLLLVALAGVGLAVARGTLTLPRPDPIDLVMGCFLLVNVGSWLASHVLPATSLYGPQPSIPSLLTLGVAFPFLAYVLGRTAARDPRVQRAVWWCVVALTGYSGLLAILQFHGPRSLVWPRFVVDAPGWRGRAVGVFNQPVTNGVLLVVGLVICLWLGGQPTGRRWSRWTAHLVAAGAVYGIYLTHTRAIWLVTALVLVAAPFVSPVYRRGAVVIVGLGVVAAAVNRVALVGTDRASGGVGSTTEIDDRLNMIATAVSAIREAPLFGWGIGRFPTVNTVFHEQWSDATPWRNGYGFAAHETELAVGVELGLVGLGLWLAVLVLLYRRVRDAHRREPAGTASGIALLSVPVLVVVGTTVDLRLIGFASTLVLLLAGLAVGCDETATTTPRAAAPPPTEVKTS